MVTLRSQAASRASQRREPEIRESPRNSRRNRRPPAGNEGDDRISKLADQIQALTETVRGLQQAAPAPPPAENGEAARSPTRRSQPPSNHHRQLSPDRSSHDRPQKRGRSAHSRTQRRVSPAQSHSVSPDSARDSTPDQNARRTTRPGSPEREDLTAKVREMQRQLEALQKGSSQKFEEHYRGVDPPFPPKIMEEEMPSRFKMPQMDPYDGTTDPEDHLASFKTLMTLQGATDAVLCKTFPATLRGTARYWFSRLESGSVHSFSQLGKLFATHFASRRVVRRGSDALLNVKQQEGESLREYLNRFNTAVLEIRDLDPSIAMSALKGGLTTSSLLFSLEKRFPVDFPEMLARAEKYARAEEAMKARRDASKSKRDGKGKHKKENQRRSRSPSPKRRPSPVKEYRRPRSPPRKFGHYTPLIKPRTEILMEIDGRGYLRSPAPLKPAKRNRNKYCRYHRDVGHDTEECRHLKDEIEALIRRGHLTRYVQPAAPPEERQLAPADPNENRPTAGVINSISGGHAGSIVDGLRAK